MKKFFCIKNKGIFQTDILLQKPKELHRKIYILKFSDHLHTFALLHFDYFCLTNGVQEFVGSYCFFLFFLRE